MITNKLREQLSIYALSKLKLRKNFAYFTFILLLSGGINLHSGPIKPPCTICSKAVKNTNIMHQMQPMDPQKNFKESSNL